MLVPFTNKHLPERHRHATAVGITCERAGDFVYYATSERGPHRYTVTLETDRGECNCLAGFAGKACKHLALCAVREFPPLLGKWQDLELFREVWGMVEAMDEFFAEWDRWRVKNRHLLRQEELAA